MRLATQPFDAAEFLDSPEMVSAYLDAALADGEPELIIAALSDTQKAARLQRNRRRNSQ